MKPLQCSRTLLNFNNYSEEIIPDTDNEINNKNYKFSKRAKENNELYGSIKPKEISNTIQNIDKIEIKPSQIDLGKEINKIGFYEATINLHAQVQGIIHIEVVKQEEEN